MTKLDSRGEPSMEEILASIRRIIAEDPPGSRLQPATSFGSMPMSSALGSAPTSPAPSQPTTSGLSREAFLRSQRLPDPVTADAAVSSAVTVEASSATKADADAQAEKINSSEAASVTDKISSSSSNASAADDVAPVEGEKKEAGKEAEAAPAQAPVAEAMADEPLAKAETASQTAAESIDAQLLDLLGEDDDIQTVEPEEPASKSVADHGASGPGFVQSHISSSSARPGFTVSRIGFGTGAPISSDKKDPFELELGPSPFAAKSTAKSDASSSASVGERRTPHASSADASAAASEALARVRAAAPSSAAFGAGPSSQPSINATDYRHDQHRAIDRHPPFESPDVAATIGPASQRNASAERATSSSDRMRSSANPFPFAHASRDAPQMRAPHATSGAATSGATDLPEQFAELKPLAQSSGSLTIFGEGSEGGALSQRSLEDTVADLLRPMLKSWLQENMPKILERALRREMSERGLEGHKAAAE